MYNKTKKLLSVALILILSLSVFSVCAFAEFEEDIFEYRISDDGFVILYDCDEKASGSVIIPAEVEIDGNNYKVRYIGNRAFESCYLITDIIIPEGVTSIRNHAFRDCISLEDIYAPESLIICQYDAFDGCNDVTVHCYTSNYQFFSVFGITANITINILDGDTDATPEEDNIVQSDNFVVNFFEALKRMIDRIMEYFNADESDFNFPDDLPFDLPFDIPLGFKVNAVLT